MVGVPGALATRRRGVGEVLPFADGEAFAGVFAREQQPHPGSQLRRHPGLVEPGGPYVARVISDFDADHLEATFAEGARLGPLNFDRDGGGLPGLEISELADAQIAVTARNVEEQVPDGADACPGGGFGGFRADALEGAETLVEDAGAGPVDGGVEELGARQLAGAGEGARYWAARSHHQLG